MTKSTLRYCANCDHIAWEPDSGMYCVHPKAIDHVSSYGATPGAMDRLGICTGKEMQLWEPRQDL